MANQWIVTSRHTVQDGLVLDWWTDETAPGNTGWLLSASRNGVLSGSGVYLDKLPDNLLTAAIKISQLLSNNDHKMAQSFVTHVKKRDGATWAIVRVPRPGIDPDDDFYEEDEPIEHVIAAWDNGTKHLTAPPSNIFSHKEASS